MNDEAEGYLPEYRKELDRIKADSVEGRTAAGTTKPEGAEDEVSSDEEIDEAAQHAEGLAKEWRGIPFSRADSEGSDSENESEREVTGSKGTEKEEEDHEYDSDDNDEEEEGKEDSGDEEEEEVRQRRAKQAAREKERLERNSMMMGKKDRRIYQRAHFGLARKAANIARLEDKRRNIAKRKLKEETGEQTETKKRRRKEATTKKQRKKKKRKNAE